MITLRPHHLDEIKRRLDYARDPYARYRWEQNVEEKYNVDFKLFIDDLMYGIFSEPDLKIKIVGGIDTICEACKNKEDRCRGNKKDMITLSQKYPYLSMNKPYSAGELISIIKENSSG